MGLLESKSNDEEKISPLSLDDEAIIQQHYKIDTDGTIRFNFKYFNKEYSELNSALQSFKSLLKIESPNEMNFIFFKINEFKNCIKTQEAKKEYETFINNAKADQDRYYDTMKRYHQEMSSIVQGCIVFLTNSLKERKVSQFNEESDHEIHLINKAKAIILDFNQFKEEIGYIDKIEKELQLSPEDLKSNDALMEKYLSTKAQLQDIFYFKDSFNYKSYLNTLEQIRNYLNSKMILLNKFVDVNQKIHQLYNTALRETKTSNDYQEAISELQQYYSVILNHRLIKHVELKLKEITAMKNK